LLCAIPTKSAPQVPATLGRLVVHIRQKGDIPVQHAFVYIHNDIGEPLANLSDQIGDLRPNVDEALGISEVILSTGATYDVFIASAGYFPESQKISVEAGMTKEVTVYLKLDEAGLHY
jgi:hypothetical protein